MQTRSAINIVQEKHLEQEQKMLIAKLEGAGIGWGVIEE